MHGSTYLQNRDGCHYLRRAIPKDLPARFGGFVTFKRCLLTADEVIAKRRAEGLLRETSEQLEEARKRLNPDHRPAAGVAPRFG